MANPYLTRDINLIIDAYTRGAYGQVTDVVAEAKDQPLGSVLNSFTGATSLSDASYAQAANKLQDYLDQAEGAVEVFYSYGVGHHPETAEEVLGVEVNNTWLAAAAADSNWEKAATVMADCIPCKDRVMSLLAMNPLDDLWDTLDQMYRAQVAFIVRLWDFVLGDKSIAPYADVCSLLQFFSFMCVPDLVGLGLVLSKLINKYAAQLADLQVTMQDLLSNIFGSALTPIIALLDKYIQLIVSPVECIIEELNHAVARLDAAEAGQTIVTGAGEDYIPDEILPTAAIGDTVEYPLKWMRGYLVEANKAIRSEFKKMNEEVKSWFEAEDRVNKNSFDIQGHIDRVANLIGLIQAIIYASIQGEFTCGPRADNGPRDLGTFINNYVNPNLGIDIALDGDSIKIVPSVPDEVKDGLGELREIITSYKQVTKTVDEPVVESPQAIVGEIIVPVGNCLRQVTDSELSKVKDYLATFE